MIYIYMIYIYIYDIYIYIWYIYIWYMWYIYIYIWYMWYIYIYDNMIYIWFIYSYIILNYVCVCVYVYVYVYVYMYMYTWPNFREHDESPVDGLRLSPTFLEATRSDHVAFVAFPLQGRWSNPKHCQVGKERWLLVRTWLKSIYLAGEKPMETDWFEDSHGVHSNRHWLDIDQKSAGSLKKVWRSLTFQIFRKLHQKDTVNFRQVKYAVFTMERGRKAGHRNFFANNAGSSQLLEDIIDRYWQNDHLTYW